MDATVSFLTPYWSGAAMMRVHLASLRRFHPRAPILVSRRGGDGAEMEAYRREFGVRYWLEDCEYTDAHLRLLERCETRYACILDHDTVLLAGLGRYLEDLATGRYDLVGVEERIRVPGADDWLRFAPGSVASNFLLFDWQAFRSKWGLRGVLGKRMPGAKDFEADYGIGQKLPRHRYLLPFHTQKYGIGNLLKDGDAAVLWHQWYGAYRMRLGAGEDALRSLVERGERAFIEDYPNLDLSGLAPAWGPERDIAADRAAMRTPDGGTAIERLRRWHGYGVKGLVVRAAARLDRWRRLL